MMNGVKHTIIGVAPEGFYGTFVGYSFQFWVPASMEETFIAGGYKLENRGAQWIEGFALLKPGVTIQQAQAEMSAVARRLEHDYPATNRGVGVKLYPLWETPFNGAGTLFPTLRMSMIVACFVLIIACANVGNLLMVRSFARRQEMTVRMSLGAGRARLLRLLLTEALILSAAAAAAGVAIAYSSRNLIMLAFPHTPGIVINLPAEMDWRVLAVCAAISLTATLLFGLVPAMQARKIDLAVAMRLESASVVGGHRRAWVRSGLVLLQVSLSFVLLVAAGLLVDSLLKMRDASPGFSTNVLTTSVDMIAAGYDRQRMKDFEDRLLERVEALGGVESAAWARSTPFSYRTPSSAPVTVEGYETAPGEQPTIEYNEVGPHYLSVIGIPLRSGREFMRADNETAPLVAVVNETMAQQFWKNADPVGRRFQLKGQSKPQWIQVVGIAKNAKYSSLIEKPKPFFYVPMRQSSPGQILQVRSRLGPDAMAHALAREVKALDPDLAPGEVITMREQIDRMSWAEGAAVTLLVIFGSIALSLAAIGLYGVVSYAVSQSTRELGLRMALGANAADLLRLVFSHMFALTLAGVALGICAALALTRLLGDLLYRVSPRDPVVFAAALAVLLAASLAACCAPALRATRIDPSRALRES
jgi:predicted permease